MFDLETFLKRNGVEEKCAHNLTSCFGVLGQASLLKGKERDGAFKLPNLSIDEGGFIYHNYNDTVRGNDNSYTDMRSVLRYNSKTGETTLGLFYFEEPSDSNRLKRTPKIKFIKIPKYGTLADAKCYSYNEDTILDFVDVLKLGINAHDDIVDSDIIDNILTNPNMFEEYYYIPDRIDNFASIEYDYDSIMGDLHSMMGNPLILIEEMAYPYFEKNNESGKTI